ncbi:MAG: tetratricopeptide repeat protein [Bryobacteraceae bacterium]
MNTHEPRPGGAAAGAFALVFIALSGLLTGTIFLTKWYRAEQGRRARAYFNQGERLTATENYGTAIEQYRNALSISRENRVYRRAIALALMKLGRRDEAAIYFHELLREDPDGALPNLMLARIEAGEGMTPLAVDDYHRAIFGYWPENAEANRRRARWELVELLEKGGSPKQVLAELLELADEERDDPAARKRIGHLLLAYGSAAQSAELFRDVIRESSQRGHRDAEAEAGLGEAELARGNYREAQNALRRAVWENPRDTAAEKRLATVNEILELDPTARMLSAAARYERSRTLVERAVVDVTACAKEGSAPPPDLDAARKALANRVKRGAYADATESDIALAERLWAARAGLCGNQAASDEPLARVLAHLSEK